MAEDCIFCKIASGEIPSTVLYEDADVLSFLDIMPAAKGHALVAPKKHYTSLIDVPHSELAAIVAIVQKIGAATMKATKAHGFNVLQSNGKAAGQEIGHVHFHVIPRIEGDNLSLAKWEQGSAEKAELEEYAKRMKRHV